jgi:hypothetical protein
MYLKKNNYYYNIKRSGTKHMSKICYSLGFIGNPTTTLIKLGPSAIN